MLVSHVRSLPRACLLVALTLVACQQKPTPLDRSRCLADQLPGTLRDHPNLTCEGDGAECRRGCERGDAASCVGLASLKEQARRDDPEAAALFDRACVLGSSNGCTNAGARMWATGVAPTPDCAARLFTRSCEARDPFACGMAARLEMERPDRDASAVKAKLEATCADLGHFTCRVLALHLEKGDFGAVDPTRVASLLARACQTGDPDACGDPASADATFHP